jgi:uncharacterized protein YndB with AHSA1/START domain
VTPSAWSDSSLGPLAGLAPPFAGLRRLDPGRPPPNPERPAATWRYLELDPPARIVMTHGWLHEGEAPEAVDARATRITVELFDEGPRTRMVFVQRGFPTPESRDGHDEGWRSSFRQLDALLEVLEAQP